MLDIEPKRTERKLGAVPKLSMYSSLNCVSPSAFIETVEE